MEEWAKKLAKEESRKRGFYVEARKIGQSRYLYRSTTRWDKERKKIVKVSEYLGRITEKGLVDKTDKKRSVFEYGNSQLVDSLSQDILKLLKESFPERWKEIYSLAVVRLLDPVPLKSVEDRWEKLHLSTTIDAAVSRNTLSAVLREVGSDTAAQLGLFRELMSSSERLAFDMSSIFSRSENLSYAAMGHNADDIYLPQINMAMIFDVGNCRPVYLKPVEGSVRDIKSLRSTLQEVDFNGVLVMDRGFASYDLAEILESRMKFIMPLRRNQKLIGYGTKLDGGFVYRGRGIRFAARRREKQTVYLFEDPFLRADESSTFIGWMDKKKKTEKDYREAEKKFGKITILSNVNAKPKDIYLMLKQREEVETAFDSMKNELENDKTYLRDDDAVRGYFFISFVSLYMYYKILALIRKKDLSDKYSVKDVLLKFSKVYKLVTDGKEVISEVPAAVEMLDKTLGTDICLKK
ncbi:MAG: transposase [Candidatus Parvarchaeota archaeon]|jgi:transposase|nr:transposase [Candidatus Parvarchaeota archaeon]MCL5420125.1 transposase [Candidatus Parvarchaeota archaeon]